MTDESTPASASATPVPAQPPPPPSIDDVQKMSPGQAAGWVDELRLRTEWVAKLLNGGDPTTLALFNALVAKRTEADIVDEVIADVNDVPLPMPGGANANGMSARDVRSGIAGLLDDGLSSGAVGELLRNQPVVSPADYRALSREFSERCLNNPAWNALLLAGDSVAKRQLLAWGTIKLTSRPLPESPRFDVVK